MQKYEYYYDDSLLGRIYSFVRCSSSPFVETPPGNNNNNNYNIQVFFVTMADVVKEKLALLRTKLEPIPALQQAEDATKVPKEFLVLGGGSLFVLLIFFGVGAGVLCSLVGFVYPAFKSFETIETKTKGDDIQWLVYWVVFALFSLLENFSDLLLYWIPFYYPFKLAFLLWAMLPQTHGSKFLYDSFLKDFLKKKESRIDAAIAESKKSAQATVAELVGNSAVTLSEDEPDPKDDDDKKDD